MSHYFSRSMKKKLTVLELFAGVGGFRVGLEGYFGKSPKSAYKETLNSSFKIIWSNQFEPTSSKECQHASMVYIKHFGESGHINGDLSAVETSSIPNADVLVGGFPCQDYSVAKSINTSKGIKGIKGVLWWEIERILREKGSNAPDYLILENVDRLLKSPAKERGRDFSIMLSSLDALNYAIEWRVINAAEYGFPQRRRRVFILGYRKGTRLYDQMNRALSLSIIEGYSVLGLEFHSIYDKVNKGRINGDNEKDITRNYKLKNSSEKSPFKKCGIFVNGNYITSDYSPLYTGKLSVLKDVLIEDNISEEFIITRGSITDLIANYPLVDYHELSDNLNLKKWVLSKKAKSDWKINKQGFRYKFSEGNMPFPDSLYSPSRTIVTGEGGAGASRFKHIVYVDGVLRRLSPVELERLNQFPDNFTQVDRVTNGRRAFLMGNALVVGVVEMIGLALANGIELTGDA